MTSENYINKIFVIIHFVLYLFCEIPLQCSANGILGTLPRSSNSKESTNVLFGQTFENNNDEQHQNVSVIRNSQVSMDINSGCPKDLLPQIGYGVTIANLTIKDTPAHPTGYQYLWSVIGHPTIQAAITHPGNFMVVDWYALFQLDSKKSLWKSIKYANPPLYTSAVMLTKLIEFNDTTKTGYLEDQHPNDTKVYDLKHFNWTRNLVETDNKTVAIRLVGENFMLENSSLAGTVNLTLSGYPYDGYGDWLPHLMHDTRTNQFDIQLQHLKSDSGFEAPRFAIEFVIVSYCKGTDGCQKQNLTRIKTTSIDDEHTPGIFSTGELEIPGINDTMRSFIQWRPIVYNSIHRELTQSTGLNMGTPQHIEDASTLYNNTLLYALYGPDLDNVFVSAINISFGRKGDQGFYDHTNYQAWTFTFGTGPPIRNKVSGVIILAVTLMAGITTLVALVAITICAARRFGRGNAGRLIRQELNSSSDVNAYQTLEED